eukprot:scaffold20941_cov143-Skeletonema_marinoi.AAC.12
MALSPSTSVSSDDEMEGRVVSYLNDYDVLNGRGKDINNLAGNISFQRLIAGNKNVVDAVRGNGGRFLKYDKSNKIYVDVGNEGARAKTSQAFRDALRKEKKESVPPVGNHSSDPKISLGLRFVDEGCFLSNQSGRITSADLSFSLGPSFVSDALAGVPVRMTSSEFCLDIMKEDDSNVQIISSDKVCQELIGTVIGI